jgi:hypothetical protein
MLNRYNPLHMFLASYGNELNRVDFRMIKESKSSSSPSSFSYNGLVYSFNPDLNMFVNQFGHAMDYAQAVALAASLGYSEQEFEGLADSTDTDGGTDRRRSSINTLSNPFVYNYSWYSFYGFPIYGKGGPAYGITWPSSYNDTKGLTYCYPAIWYFNRNYGLTLAGVWADNLTFNSPYGFSGGWTGIGGPNNNDYQYFWNKYEYVQRPTVPNDFTFGATNHGFTLEIDNIIDAYSWIPPEHRMFMPGKLWSAFTDGGGITGIEYVRRTNLILQSQNLHITPWNTSNGATALSLGDTAPDGSLTATRIVYNNIPGTTSYNFGQNINLSNPSATYSSSIWLRGLTAGLFVEFLPNQNIISSGGSWGSISLGTAWTRYQAQFIVQPPATTMGMLLRVVGVTGPNIGAGNTYASQIIAWGGQIEENEIATNYIPTTTTTVSENVVNGLGNVWVSPYKARKTQYAEREMRNILTALKNRGFTMSGMLNDDEAFYASSLYTLNRTSTASGIEKNLFRTSGISTGNTWWIGFTGASAAPRSLFLNTGVTNFRDLLILRGSTTNTSQAFCVDLLNISQNNSKDSINPGGSSNIWQGSVWDAVIQEFVGYFVEDAMVQPFKEIMVGTGNTTAIINNYSYKETYGTFLGNNPLPNNLTLVSPDVETQIYPTTSLSEPKATKAFAGIDISTASSGPEFSKNGNQGSMNLYGPFPNNYIGVPTNIGARIINGSFNFGSATTNLFDFGRIYYGNTYGYAGSSLGIKSNYEFMVGSAYSSAGQNTGPMRLHVPGNYRGVSVNGGLGFTFNNSSFGIPNNWCMETYARNYSGVSAGMGATCTTCNGQAPKSMPWFFHDIFGITQCTDRNGPVNMLPTNLWSAVYGVTQGAYTVEALTTNPSYSGALFLWDSCGFPYPGITFLPGTIYRDYDTHWYPMGWFAFVADLCSMRSMARTEMLKTFVERNAGNPAAQQNPSHYWILDPNMAIMGTFNLANDNTAYMKDNGVYYYGYFKPKGITYDVSWQNWDGSGYKLRGATFFYGDINDYWAENFRHAFLHKANAFTTWGGGEYSCVVNPGRTEPVPQWNRNTKVLAWPVLNPDEVRGILGNDKVVAAPTGVCGFTLGGVCGDLVYRGGMRVNTLLHECNTTCKGMVNETMYLAPVNNSEKEYHISGAQLVDGSYMWRITFLHPASEVINVRGSVTNQITQYNIAGVTNFIDNANHHRGVWWSSSTYEIPVVLNPPQPINPGLPAGTTTWNGVSAFP